MVNHAEAYKSLAFAVRSTEPVLIGGLEKGKYLMPGTALAGEHSAEEIRTIAAGLD